MVSLFEEVTAAFTGSNKASSPQPTLTHLLMAVSKAVDLLEGRPLRHGIRVALLAGTLAQKIQLPERERMAVVQAALLHDVGLPIIASEFAQRLPAGVTEKPFLYAHALLNAGVARMEQAISADAGQILQAHPQMAARFIEAAHLSADVQELIAAHHELWDGSGYPLGLSGEAIPVGSRIIALADVLEAVIQEANGPGARAQAVSSFLDSPVSACFDPMLLEACRQQERHGDWEPLLRTLYSSEAEATLITLVPDRHFAIAGSLLLDIAQATAHIVDGLLPSYAWGHSERVAILAFRMAQQLGIGAEQRGELLLAGLLHDIGMMAVPLPLLLKAEDLSRDEWPLVYDHPRYSEEILKAVPGFERIGLWTGEHHERMNGSGYHGGRKGFEISLGGRILAVADVYEALTARRPYRQTAHEPMDALPLLDQGRFRLFDNQLLGVLRSTLRNTELIVV